MLPQRTTKAVVWMVARAGHSATGSTIVFSQPKREKCWSPWPTPFIATFVSTPFFQLISFPQFIQPRISAQPYRPEGGKGWTQLHTHKLAPAHNTCFHQRTTLWECSNKQLDLIYLLIDIAMNVSFKLSAAPSTRGISSPRQTQLMKHAACFMHAVR